ncbi:hypothetical protein SAMN04488120_1213 [Fontimonas thermophila]|uniref:Glycosyltransferase n=1 Tax=Fontimonas thermophila TaxID=1076937 RepID=A0A1I2KI66_9GAMM|nr:TIGR04282 family arsenosugar biosynthesis glycosyltransferase [Fontimonas thermophila]SFF66685.1 hypothetical protein SAMN04488120_1213 [Fontimonas thermophila]
MRRLRIVIFAKAPLPGMAKTRLIPALGEQGSARLAQRMLRHAVDESLAAAIGDVELCVTPQPDAPPWRPWRDRGWPVDWQWQGEGDLGARLDRAARRVLSAHDAVLLIGTDCPGLTRHHLQLAARQLMTHEAVIIPSTDGGYVLLGLVRHHPHIFEEIPWSTNRVCAETLARIGTLGWTVAQLAALSDIDEPADLAAVPPGWLA